MAEKDPSEESGRLRTQRAIFDSEFFWYGELMDSHKIHERMDAPFTDTEEISTD